MAKKNKNKKNSPSRIKYEQNHPVISSRAPKEIRDRIEAVKKAERKSILDILKVGLGILEAKVRAEKDIRAEAYQEGMEYGYDAGRELYMVTYPCAVCKEMIEVTTDEEKEAIAEYMAEQGWGHSECINGES